MSDPRTPPRVPDLAAPSGPPLYAWFAGVVEGDRGGSDAGLHDAAAAIERLGLGRADLELEGARFTLLLSGEAVAGDRLDEAGKHRFIAALDGLVRAAGVTRPLESTLRCTEVHADRTVETLFAIEGGRIRPWSRVRTVDAEDRRRAPHAADAPPEFASFGRRRAVAVLLIVAAIGAIAIWRSGLVGRLTSPDPEELPVLTTEFGDRLAVTVKHRFGDYRVEIRRSPTFPDSDAALALWRDRLVGARERIAWQSLAGEGTVHVHSLGEESRRLHSTVVNLRPLIVDGREVIVARLRGDPRTTGFAISPVESWGK
jgi:hypothetical protein